MRLLLYYVRWHYGKALVDYINIVRNFVWFFYEFFSIQLMAKTLFAPFKRLGDTYEKKGFNFNAFLETFIINTLMRIVGFCLRTVLIFFGAVFMLVTVLFGITFFIVWLIAPLFLLFLVVYGFKLFAVS